MDGGGKEGGMVGGISRPIQSTPGLPRKRGVGPRGSPRHRGHRIFTPAEAGVRVFYLSLTTVPLPLREPFHVTCTANLDSRLRGNDGNILRKSILSGQLRAKVYAIGE